MIVVIFFVGMSSSSDVSLLQASLIAADVCAMKATVVMGRVVWKSILVKLTGADVMCR